MSRINVVRDGELVGWFDDSSITERFEEKTYFDGRNCRSVNTGSQWDHHELIRTAEGRWVLHHTSQWQHKRPRWEFISDWEAKQWLLLNDYDRDVERIFGPIPPEQGPGVDGDSH